MWLFQLVDYVIKALVNYRLTPEGEKEWNDFVSAFQADDAGSFDPFAVRNDTSEQARAQSVQPAQQRQQQPRARARGGMEVVGDRPFVNTNASQE